MDGIIVVNKERDYTSFDVVAKLRGILKMRKMGHTGTLDPMATGVLPVCLGAGTKLCDMMTDSTKIYRAVMLLGKDFDTEDVTGELLHEAEVHVSEEQIRAAAAFRIDQGQAADTEITQTGACIFRKCRIKRKAAGRETGNRFSAQITHVAAAHKGAVIQVLDHALRRDAQLVGTVPGIQVKNAGFIIEIYAHNPLCLRF